MKLSKLITKIDRLYFGFYGIEAQECIKYKQNKKFKKIIRLKIWNVIKIINTQKNMYNQNHNSKVVKAMSDNKILKVEMSVIISLCYNFTSYSGRFF